MNQTQVMEYIQELKDKKKVRVYTPFKYFKGLNTKSEIRSRFNDMLLHKQNKTSYEPFRTDLSNPSTQQSHYTTLFYRMYGTDAKSLARKSEVSGVPLIILRQVFQKGKAAWRSGHRVGATQTQWGYARVHSFLMLGCTVFSSDFKLFEEAILQMSPKNRKRWLAMQPHCPKSSLHSSYYKKLKRHDAFLALRKHYVG